MKYVTAKATFASTHLEPSEGPYLHGHTFSVWVTELGTIDTLPMTLGPDLRALVSELDHRHLADMLTGGSQTLDGIATWIMERLLGRHPRIVRVEVEAEDGVRAGVMREVR